MTIESERTGNVMVMTLSGRLDTATAPQLERKIKQWGEDITELTLDFTELSYISSMGLRVLLQTQKTMSAQGRKLFIKNMNESIREVFEMTGFIRLMVQEEKFVVIRKDEDHQTVLSLIGQMDADNVPALAKELSQIKEVKQLNEGITTLVLDAARLTLISPGACRLLRRAIEESYWDKRKLIIQNALQEIGAVFQTEGMGDLFAQDSHSDSGSAQ
jgi:anti-sigma B factor antagonist